MSTQTLVDIGLTEKEAQLYMLLLEEGEQPIQELVRKSKLKRPTVYATLKTLKEKELVSLRDKAKKLHAHPLAPDHLLSVAKNGVEQAQNAHANLATILPQLVSNYILNVEKPVVQVFEGVDGLKQIYEEMLKVKAPIYATLQFSEASDELRKWLDTTFTKKRIELGIHVHVIAIGDKRDKYVVESPTSLRSVRYLQHPQFAFEHEMDIFGDNIAFIDHNKGNKLIGVLITRANMARTMRAVWELAWMGAEVQARQEGE